MACGDQQYFSKQYSEQIKKMAWEKAQSLYDSGLISKKDYEERVMGDFGTNDLIDAIPDVKCPTCGINMSCVSYHHQPDVDLYTMDSKGIRGHSRGHKHNLEYHCSKCYTDLVLNVGGYLPKKFTWDKDDFEKITEEELQNL